MLSSLARSESTGERRCNEHRGFKCAKFANAHNAAALNRAHSRIVRPSERFPALKTCHNLQSESPLKKIILKFIRQRYVSYLKTPVKNDIVSPSLRISQ